jgi:hypothetical protein
LDWFARALVAGRGEAGLANLLASEESLTRRARLQSAACRFDKTLFVT